MPEDKIETHPIQIHHTTQVAGKCPKVVTMLAYEVYCNLYGEHDPLVTGNCRGGFSTGELIAFLYARSFPESEWEDRFNEALKGAQNL